MRFGSEADFELRTTKAWTMSSQTLSGEFVGYKEQYAHSAHANDPPRF